MLITGENKMIPEQKATSTCWFVGAAYGRVKDQTQRFIDEGIWENGYEDKYIDHVKIMRPGDRIAIKAAYTRKNEVGFDARGNTVSVMAIKATGTILENPGNGKYVKVKWNPLGPVREWFFYTYRGTVWKVVPGARWHNDALIAFAFDNIPQDIDSFRNDPYWLQRFGDLDKIDRKFSWSSFYEAVASALLVHKADRTQLLSKLNSFAGKVDYMTYLHDRDNQGTIVPLVDICPFTVLGIFNRGITVDNRKEAARELAAILDVDVPIPESFDGIPFLNNQKSMYFGYLGDRKPEDIGKLWNVFEKAMELADGNTDDFDAGVGKDFLDAYNEASHVYCVGWNLSMGLYWIRPWFYLPLDRRSRTYISKKLNIKIGLGGPRRHSSAEEYVALMDILSARFLEDGFPVHSYPELSLAAWQYRDPTNGGIISEDDDQSESDDEVGIHDEIESFALSEPPQPYSLAAVLEEGCFLSADRLTFILESLRLKQNLILQGPPGTGKTWLAKRLGYALIGAKDESKLRAVQFHPNMSYEDFVRGFRPNGQGRLDLVDGPFMQMIEAAAKSAEDTFVLVIEEINRGNPAQIFGEMLTLMEADKRNPDEALELSYRRYKGERVSVPKNLYIIGTMNLADRSLALVDLALRRRFAFIELQPCFNDSWRSWVLDRIPSISMDMLNTICNRIEELNATIEADPNLKRQFRIGHSFLTPSHRNDIKEPLAWYRQVVETQIAPLLDEYWFDNLEVARKATERLLEGL
jgi:5-methylcytosine-specific restriction protein B